MARVEGGAVVIDTDWPGLKNQIDTRNINFKYEEDATAYEIFAIDGQYFYKTIIYKSGQAPENQATYDTWRSEFEADYKNKVTDFNSTQPVFLTSIDGYSVVLKDGNAPTSNDGYGVAVIGSDGSNYRMLKTDSSGRPVFVGAGTAGSAVGGVLTIQGDPSGTPLPISGNITASNASVSDNDLAIPLFSNLIGGSDGTNLRPLRVFDVDSGGGQQWVLGVGLRKASGGGSVEFGTSSDPIRIDPTGTTTQPVSGTVTANQGGTWTVQPGNTANTTPWLTTISQGGNSATVTGSNALKVDGSAVTQPVSGTVTVTQSTASNLRAQLASETSTGSSIPSTAVMVAGSDGSLLRAIFVDSSGRPFVVGAAANGAAVAGNPVLIGGSDGTNARTIRTTTDGTIRIDPTGTTTQPVSGTVTANAGSGTFTVSGTVTANIGTSGSLALDATLAKLTIAQSTSLGSNTQALVGGSVTTAAPSYTNGNINPLSLTTSGALRVDGSAVTQPVSGTVTANAGTGNFTVVQSTASNLRSQTSSESNTGSAVPTQASMIGGTDGTNLRAISVDSSGRQIVIGAAADGAAVTGNPVLIAGQDGINTQSIFTDTIGRQVMVGASPDGSAVTGNPVLIGGQDGTNAQSILTDTTGRQVMVGAAADGAAVTGNPVLIAGQDGTNAQSIATDGYGRIQVIITGSGSGSAQVEGRAADGATPVGNPVYIAGYDGTNIQSILTDNLGRIITAPAGAASTSGFSFGDIALSSVTTSVVRRTTYNEPSTNAQRSISSANANDTSAGTGARQVKITYYDSTGAGPSTETVTLNGTSAVNTVSSTICFIEKMEVVSVGSGGQNAGIITLFNSTAGGGGTLGTIAAGDNRTYWSHHYVPTGKTNYLTSISVVVNGGGALFFVRSKVIGVSTAVDLQASDYVRSATQSGTSTREYGTPIQTVGPARLLMYVTTEANTSLTYRGAFDYYDQ